LRRPAEAVAGVAIEALVDLLANDPRAPVSAQSRCRSRDVHIADSLVGLEVKELAVARRIADLGSGAGLPGLVLAAFLPRARVDLIESSSRKCAFLLRAASRMGLANATVVCERAESWGASEGREAYDAVTARALGRLATVAELASPLLRTGGVVVAWKGRRDEVEEAELERAVDRTAVEPVEVRQVSPYRGSRDRHIHLLRKNGPTPDELPRRPGAAAKRPFGVERTS
jgi:16S rRNA (guanine527-N7)-methyltransferase